MQNHFELFGLAQRYTLDALALERAYRDIQARIHPDRYADAGEAERRASLQWSTRVNEAYATLREPLRRARYLLELRGVAFDEAARTAIDPAFLMEQMERREALEAASRARDMPTLEALRRELRLRRARLEAELAASFDGGSLDTEAVGLVHALQFLSKEAAEIDAALNDGEA